MLKRQGRQAGRRQRRQRRQHGSAVSRRHPGLRTLSALRYRPRHWRARALFSRSRVSGCCSVEMRPSRSLMIAGQLLAASRPARGLLKAAMSNGVQRLKPKTCSGPQVNVQFQERHALCAARGDCETEPQAHESELAAQLAPS